MVSSPLTKQTYLTSLSTFPTGTLKVISIEGAAGCPWSTAKPGKALTGSATLDAGQDLIKAAARVKTALRPRDEAYGDAAPIRSMATRWMLVCNASVAKMEAATAR